MKILSTGLDDYVNKYLKKEVIAIPIHPNRDCVYEECLAVRRAQKDLTSRAVFQVERYLDEGMPGHWGLWETGIIFRKLELKLKY